MFTLCRSPEGTEILGVKITNTQYVDSKEIADKFAAQGAIVRKIR